MIVSKLQKRQRRHRRIRTRISGSGACPRLVVSRSLRKNYAQLIDDSVGKVLACADDTAFLKEGTKSERAKRVGVLLAEKAKEKNIMCCVFDRNGYKYHGRVKNLADGAREAGLTI